MADYNFFNSKFEEEVYKMVYKYYYTQNILRNISIYKDKFQKDASSN